ncbi:MAG: DUF3619 family protein [Gammaproteobacteria bacterium]|nr:DUF3619 family protein [Gammaproteobacteria bacterium]
MIGDHDGDERFAARVAAMLDSSIEGLPPHIEARLDSMRSTALVRVVGHDTFVRSAGLILSGEEAAEGLPPSVSARLDDIRAQALQRAARQLEQSSHPAGWGVLARLLNPQLGIPVGAFASVCVLVTTLALFSVREPNEVVPVAMNEEGLVLASADDLELYENLEFYQWLADNGL